jgi:hypothetical protein
MVPISSLPMSRNCWGNSVYLTLKISHHSNGDLIQLLSSQAKMSGSKLNRYLQSSRIKPIWPYKTRKLSITLNINSLFWIREKQLPIGNKRLNRICIQLWIALISEIRKQKVHLSTIKLTLRKAQEISCLITRLVTARNSPSKMLRLRYSLYTMTHLASLEMCSTTMRDSKYTSVESTKSNSHFQNLTTWSLLQVGVMVSNYQWSTASLLTREYY